MPQVNLPSTNKFFSFDLFGAKQRVRTNDVPKISDSTLYILKELDANTPNSILGLKERLKVLALTTNERKEKQAILKNFARNLDYISLSTFKVVSISLLFGNPVLAVGFAGAAVGTFVARLMFSNKMSEQYEQDADFNKVENDFQKNGKFFLKQHENLSKGILKQSKEREEEFKNGPPMFCSTAYHDGMFSREKALNELVAATQFYRSLKNSEQWEMTYQLRRHIKEHGIEPVLAEFKDLWINTDNTQFMEYFSLYMTKIGYEMLLNMKQEEIPSNHTDADIFIKLPCDTQNPSSEIGKVTKFNLKDMEKVAKEHDLVIVSTLTPFNLWLIPPSESGLASKQKILECMNTIERNPQDQSAYECFVKNGDLQKAVTYLHNHAIELQQRKEEMLLTPIKQMREQVLNTILIW